MEILDYSLPENKIASKPHQDRSESKLLTYLNGSITDNVFSNLPNILDHSYNLILNETKVVNARLLFQKHTGGRIEVFCLEPYEGDITEKLTSKGSVEWNCLVGRAKKWKEEVISVKLKYLGNYLVLNAEKISIDRGVFRLKFTWSNPELTFSEILEVFGKVPLPPYIKRNPEEADDLRYQTVFAKNEGSVAAPTASLHFTKEILDNLKASGVETAKVNLHVGAGTFKPISDSIESHEMHKEMFLVPLDELDKLRTLENIIAVGTTSVRTLESLYILAHDIQSGKQTNLSTPLKVEQWSWKTQNSLFNSYEEAFDLLYKECIRQGVNKIHGYTSLMIIPGFKFRVIKGLITNFHMPKSTLLLLVAALIGDSWKTVYDFALNHDYRFLSYGDSSLLIP